jgi:hypothetical protein
VRVIAKATPGHTRCPAYIRGKEGVIQLVYPIAYYPNFEHIRRREHSYAVEFAAAHVDGDPSQTVLVELLRATWRRNECIASNSTCSCHRACST